MREHTAIKCSLKGADSRGHSHHKATSCYVGQITEILYSYICSATYIQTCFMQKLFRVIYISA